MRTNIVIDAVEGENSVGYNFCVSDKRFRREFTVAQPKVVQFDFGGVVPADISGYALVLLIEMVSMSSDGQKHLNLILSISFLLHFFLSLLTLSFSTSLR